MQDLIVFGCLTLTVVALFRIVKADVKHYKDGKVLRNEMKDLDKGLREQNASDTSDAPKKPMYRVEK